MSDLNKLMIDQLFNFTSFICEVLARAFAIFIIFLEDQINDLVLVFERIFPSLVGGA